MDFQGFTAADFDAYAQTKWSSNVFNIERLQVKQKLEALSRSLAAEMVAGDGAPLDMEISAEHPTVWNQRSVDKQYLFFCRNKEARAELEGIISRGRSMASLVHDPSPLRNHVLLSITVNQAGVELALKLHADAAVDRDNLLRKSQDFFQREKLLTLITQLPESFTLGTGTDSDDPAPVRQLDDARLQQTLEVFSEGSDWLVIGQRTDSAAAVALASDFAGHARNGLTVLLPVMHHIAWRRDNDHVSMRETLRERGAKQRSKGLTRKDRVRVVSGVFAGKTGSVEGIDPKGSVKVRLGNMVLKLAGDELVKL